MFHLFPSNNSDAAKRGTDLPRFPHLISNHKLIVRFYSCVFSMFYLEFYNRLFFLYLFFFIQQVDSLEKGKLSCFILCSKNSPPFDQSFKLCAFSLLYADPFYTWLTIYIYRFFTLFSLKDMNVCVIHGFPLTNH